MSHLIAEPVTVVSNGSDAGLFVTLIVVLAVAAFYVLVMWKIFTKAGRPGWASIIPIYDACVLCRIAGRSGWWVLLLMIPIVNIVIAVILCVDLAKAFGKGGAFGFFGVFLFGIIGLPILAFGNARYVGRNRSGGVASGGGNHQPAVMGGYER